MNLRFHRLAVAEIDHEVEYYEARQPGLGVELEAEIDTVFAIIVTGELPGWRAGSMSLYPQRASMRAIETTRSVVQAATAPSGA